MKTETALVVTTAGLLAAVTRWLVWGDTQQCADLAWHVLMVTFACWLMSRRERLETLRAYAANEESEL